MREYANVRMKLTGENAFVQHRLSGIEIAHATGGF